MRLEKRQPSGREKDEAALELLEKLREQLYCSNISTIRQSAFHLSWMQEDGLDILKEALLGDTPRRTKSAAAYGLRKMRGRMRKRAEGILLEATAHSDALTAEISRNALTVIKKSRAPAKHPPRSKGKPTGRFQIREIPSKAHSKKQPHKGRKSDGRHRTRRR